jgi:hypothetical protein
MSPKGRLLSAGFAAAFVAAVVLAAEVVQQVATSLARRDRRPHPRWRHRGGPQSGVGLGTATDRRDLAENAARFAERLHSPARSGFLGRSPTSPNEVAAELREDRPSSDKASSASPHP